MLPVKIIPYYIRNKRLEEIICNLKSYKEKTSLFQKLDFSANLSPSRTNGFNGNIGIVFSKGLIWRNLGPRSKSDPELP